MTATPGRSRVLIAGAGVGALEAALGLQALAADRVEITLLAPDREFVYRALAVGEPFGHGPVLRRGLEAIAQDRGFGLVPDAIDAVEPDTREAITTSGAAFAYDHLVLALGARPRVGVPGALTFRGPQDAGRTAMALATLSLRAAPHVVFAAPEGASWTLPMYELALMTAHWARQRPATLRISIVTPEERPLAIFGRSPSETVDALLAEAEIDVRCGRSPGAFSHGRLDLDGGAALPASAVIALPRLQGPAIKGLPHDPDGFVDVDDLCRVQGAERVYAAGDMTSRTIKQGGLAAQQADVVAQAIASAEGAAPAPAPYRPVLRGLLLTGETPYYLRNDTDRGSEVVAGEPPWWPAHKIASRHLGPYLAATAGVPA
jgi:sulfide:quinone oxidoreductase